MENLNKRLQESHQRAEEQYEKQLSSHISQECESKRDVLIEHLDDFEANYESDSDSDEFLEILSSKCSIEVSNLSLSQLTADQLGEILSILDKLLFDEWISALPSISTLQHTQVFITELCALSLEISEDVSLQSISNHVQSLVESISQSACGVFESFLLTQALYLNLMHFINNNGSSDSDAVLIAKQWAEYELSTEILFLIEFLSTLISSLQSTVGRASVFILKMEIQCLKLLLSTLTHLNGKEAHSESTEMLLRLVQINQWTPMEAVTLLKALSQKYADDASISEVLTLVQVYDISPDWTDDCGRSVIQVLESSSPERFHQDFQKTLRRKDESSLTEALAEVKMLWNLDDSFIDMIKNIITGVLQHTKNAPEDNLFIKDSFKCESLNADSTQKCLSLLCKAVFDVKGWWPTVRQMVQWCALVLTQKSGVLQLVGVEEDPCVTAMFAATQVCMGNKLDIVLSTDVHSEERTKEWLDFYKYLDISVNTNMKKTYPSLQDVHEADIVNGTMDDFVSDYFQHGIDVMETGNPHVCRGFITEKQSLRASHNLELSVLKDNDSLLFAADVLQNLMSQFHSEDVELRHMFIKALFHMLHSNLNKDTITDSKIIRISKKIFRKELASNEVFILTFETLLQVFTRETEADKNTKSPARKWCLRILFSCVEQFQDSKEETTEVFKMVSNLGEQRPVEVLNLLGELIDHHHDDGCIFIMKILHLKETYQIFSEWTDEDSKTLFELIDSITSENLIQHLQKSLKDEETKSIDNLFYEIQKMKEVDEQILNKSFNIVTHVTDLNKSKKTKKHTNIQKARTLGARSHSMEVDDLQEILAVLCNAVHLHKAEKKWWPRTTQMISWCLLALSDTGKLLEMGTGEGKSGVIAMFAVLRVLWGQKVDVASSSSVLCQRAAEEWTEFYKYFGITVDTNTHKTDDEDRKECYQKDMVYGTIEAFAADHLRQIFEMKDVRPDRSFQCIIIDEVDSLLLDQGVQLTYLTYLSSPMVSMQHLNTILTMIWSHVCQYSFLSTGHQTFVRGPPASFFKAIFDSMNTEESEISGPLYILSIAEESNIVPSRFTEDFYKSEKDELLIKLKTVSQDAMVDFFHEIEHYVPYGFTVYTLDGKALLSLQKRSPYNGQDIPALSFLILEKGLCCLLYESEEILIKPIAELISERIQYTPCESNKDKISIPGFLKDLVEKKVSVWVQNAFLATQLKKGREYVVENDNICSVDFRLTGIIELNKKWGNGLQQFVEIKHQVKLSTISAVTYYISNISFFEKFQGKIYGTTGTLVRKADIQFLQDLYPNLSACRIPTFNRKKLFEVKGTLNRTAEEWKSEAIVFLQFATMSSADSANSNSTRLQKHLTKSDMFSYFNKNTSEAIQKLDEIESMVTGEFTSIGISKVFKCLKTLLKFGKQLKSMPTFLCTQAKDGFSFILKTNLKNRVNNTGKEMAKEIIGNGIGKAQEEIQIPNGNKNQFKEQTDHNIKLKIEKEPSFALIDLIIVSQLEDKKQIPDPPKDESKKKELLAVFKDLNKTAVQPFNADLSWQNKLNSSLSTVIQKAKAHTKGKAFAILTAVQAVHIGALAEDAIDAVLTLSEKFFSTFQGQLNKFKGTHKYLQNINRSDLSDGAFKLLKEFKQDSVNTINVLLPNVFHHKFSSNIVSIFKGKLNGAIGRYVRKGLKSERTEENLNRAGQYNRYIACMPRNLKSKHKVEEQTGQRSQVHAAKIKKSTTAGTILDIRLLSEVTDTKVVILTEDRNGRLTKMQEFDPDTGPTKKTVTLIYRPKSAQYPDGRYDVHINNQTASIESKDKTCLFLALPRGMKPQASQEEITLEAHRLQSVEIDALIRHPGQWKPFIKRKELTEAIRGGVWYMAEGAAKEAIKESKKLLQREVGKVKLYKEWQKYAVQNPGIGQFINADHQPTVSSILKAHKQNQNSKLAEAMLEVATKSSPLDPTLIPKVHSNHGRELPTVYVPKEIHYEFPSTKNESFRVLLAAAIRNDDTVGTFKLTVLGSMPRFWLDSTKNFKNFQNNARNKTKLSIFQNSFQKHSTELVEIWFTLLQNKGVMTNNHLTTITDWINKQGYNDQNDPHRNEVTNQMKK